MVSEQVVKLTSWVGMASKKNRKQPQDSVLEEPVDDQVAPPKSIGEEEPMPWEDRDEPESEEEQRLSSICLSIICQLASKFNCCSKILGHHLIHFIS
jgi:hypothetical protein